MRRRRFQQLGAGALATVGICLPDVAFACAVCFNAREQTRVAFIDTMILLTLVPLTVIGGGAYWIYRRAQQLDTELEPNVD